MWRSFVDKIYVINLARRTDRMQQAQSQLEKYDIPFERWEAIGDANGAEGLRFTMEQIFSHAISSNYHDIIIFEDDVDIIEPTFNEVMNRVIGNLPQPYDIIYLGCQLCSAIDFYNDVLIRSNCMYATHAAMYSLQGMKKFMDRPKFSPIDNYIVQYIQNDGLCYATYPILASQIISKSDIYNDKEFINWKPHLEQKYWNQILQLKINNKIPSTAKSYVYEQ